LDLEIRDAPFLVAPVSAETRAMGVGKDAVDDPFGKAERLRYPLLFQISNTVFDR
jgi:hypothetical protein